MLDSLDVKIKVSYSHNHQSNAVERFHKTLWALLRTKKCNSENDWEKVYHSNASIQCKPTLLNFIQPVQNFSWKKTKPSPSFPLSKVQT